MTENEADLMDLCTLLMIHDDEDELTHAILRKMANLHARGMGYTDWVDAYHKLPPKEEQ